MLFSGLGNFPALIHRFSVVLLMPRRLASSGQDSVKGALGGRDARLCGVYDRRKVHRSLVLARQGAVG